MPGNANFILAPNFPNDWRSPQNDNLWQGLNGINNPCPAGYRIPTEAEWAAERDSWISLAPAGAFSSPLKLPQAGFRYEDGPFVYVGTVGSYRSSTKDDGYSRSQIFYDSDVMMVAHLVDVTLY